MKPMQLFVEACIYIITYFITIFINANLNNLMFPVQGIVTEKKQITFSTVAMLIDASTLALDIVRVWDGQTENGLNWSVNECYKLKI